MLFVEKFVVQIYQLKDVKEILYFLYLSRRRACKRSSLRNYSNFFDKKHSLIFPFPFLSTEIITTGLMYNILVGKPEPALSRAKSKLRASFIMQGERNITLNIVNE